MILITRPKERAMRLSEILNKKDIPHHIDSLIEFKHEVKDKFELLNKFILISSVETVHSMQINNIIKNKMLNDVSINVIGDQAAALLNELGIFSINKIFQDFGNFKKFMDDQNIFQKIDYLCSDIISDEAQQLVDQGRLRKVVFYKTIPAENLSDATLELLDKDKIHAVLIYSKFTAITFIKLVRKHNLLKQAKQMTYYCLSERIARELQKNSLIECQVSSRPNQESLINLLKK